MDLTSANLTICGYPCLTHFGVNVSCEKTHGLLSVSHIKKGVCDKTLKRLHIANRNVDDLRMTQSHTFSSACISTTLKGSHVGNRNVIDLRMAKMDSPLICDPEGVEPDCLSIVRPCQGRKLKCGIQSAHLTICGYPCLTPLGSLYRIPVWVISIMEQPFIGLDTKLHE